MVDSASEIQPPAESHDLQHAAGAAERCRVLRKGRGAMRGAGAWIVGALATLFLLVGLALGGFFVLLSMGPISVDALGARLAAVLDARLGGDYAVTVGHTTIEQGADGPHLAIADFHVTGRGRQPVFEAPRVTVSIDPLPLLVGRVSPRRLDVFGLDLRLIVRPNGSVALSAAREAAPAAPPDASVGAPADQLDPPVEAVAEALAERDAVAPLAASLRRLLAMAVGSGFPLSALERVGIAGGRLVFDDRPGRRSYLYSNLEVGFEKVAETARLTVSAEGPNGRWRVSAQARGDTGANEGESSEGLARSLDVDVNNLSVDEITLIAGLRDPAFDFDMPVSGRLNMALAPDGKLEMASGRFRVGTGFFYIKDPDHEPLPIDEVSGGFRWDVAARRFEIEPVQFDSNRTHLSLSGLLTPPEGEADEWSLTLGGKGGVFGAERPGEKDIVLDRSDVVARFDPKARSFALQTFALTGPDLAYSMSGDGEWTPGARRLSLRAQASRTRAKTIMRLWPTTVAAHTRAWLLQNQNQGFLDSGSMSLDLDEAAFVAIHDHRPIADRAVAVEFAISEAQLGYLPGAPPLSGLSGKGRVTGRTAAFVANSGYVDLGAKGRLSLMEARFDAPDFDRKPTPATVAIRAGGSIDAVTDLLARDAFKAYGGFSAEPGSMKGQVDARVNVDLRLGKEAGDDVATVRVSAQIANLSIEKLVGKERLDQATLSIVADAAGLKASGQGRLFGQPARIELKKPAQGVAEAVLNMTLDEAARAKQGWSLGAALTGPVSARVTSPLGMGDKARPQVELDLTKAAIGAVAPGFSKPAGRAGKASFQLVTEGEKTSLQSFSFESGAASAQGFIEFDAGGFSSAKMTQVRLSPGDDMRVDAQQVKDTLRLVVRGGTIDARPFIQDLLANSAPGARDSESAPREIDLDLKANLLTGNNGQSVANMEMKLVKRVSGVREFRLSGRTGRAALTGGMLTTGPSAAPQFFVRSSDGGALMSFLDIYRRMEGGQLQLVALGAGNQMSGVFSVREFTLRNEPALRRLVNEGAGNRDDKTPPPIDTNSVAFDRLQVAFQRTGARLDLRDGAINGPSVGATVEGMLDFGRDQVALNGTFVPAYGVNNLFSKIPLFGPILGGGANEGLIGVNFRISGPASAPVLSINPLSAIAPGFLRKIFGAADALQTPRLPEPAPEARPRMPLSVSPAR